MAGKDEFQSLDETLRAHLPGKELSEVLRILYGAGADALTLPDGVVSTGPSSSSSVEELEDELEVKGYKFACDAESIRPPRIVRVGVIQHQVKVDTSLPVLAQYEWIEKKIGKIIDIAGKAGVNVLCLQEAWTMPFAFCPPDKKFFC